MHLLLDEELDLGFEKGHETGPEQRHRHKLSLQTRYGTGDRTVLPPRSTSAAEYRSE